VVLFKTPQYFLVLQVHPIIWKEVQQRGPCAFRQAAVRAGHHPQTGDQFDAELCPSPHHPSEVRLTLYPHGPDIDINTGGSEIVTVWSVSVVQ